MSAEDDFSSGSLQDYRLNLQASTQQSLENMSLADLLTLKAEIDGKLPRMDLASLDMGKEIIFSFYTAKAQLAVATNPNSDVPANQRAQLINTCNASLNLLVKLQKEIWNAEQLKKLENILAKVLKTLPATTQDTFFELYGRELGEAAVIEITPEMAALVAEE